MMSRKFSAYNNIKYMIGDVRDLTRTIECMKKVDYVFHLAALKHVPVCEDYPEESVKTNVTGTENVVKAAKQNDVKMVIDVSTDKACNPINVYGSCKSL
jgi:FlaA1/EpsC-like NDP-sugar epimerase